MAGRRSNRELTLSRRAEIARLALFGNPTQQEIAEKVGLDVSTVCRHLKAIREEWRQSAKADIEDVISNELKKLDALELEAMTEWGRSKQDYEKRVVEDRPAGAKVGGGRFAKIEKGGQTGDPRYLQVILGIQDRRAKLLGTDKPQKVAPTTPEGHELPQGPVIVALPAQLDAEAWAQAFSKKPG